MSEGEEEKKEDVEHPDVENPEKGCRGWSRYVEGCWGPLAWKFVDLEIYQDSTIVKLVFKTGRSKLFWTHDKSKIFKNIL